MNARFPETMPQPPTPTRCSLLAGLLVAWLVGGGCLFSGEGGGDVDWDASIDVGGSPDAGPDAEPRWQPNFGELYSEGDGCRYPACDASAPESVAVDREWAWTKETTNSTCTGIIRETDDRAQEGTVSEGAEVIGDLEGSCLYDESGDRIGTVRDGTLAACVRTERRQDVVSYTLRLVQFDGDRGEGRLRSLIRNAPDFAGGNCEIDRSLSYEK